jgi:hypothetical protein
MRFASGSSKDSPSGANRYSTLGGLVGKTWRVIRPSRSKSRSVWVSIRLVGAGLPVPVAQHLTAIDITTRKGDFDSATDLVERLTGTPARSFRDFLTEKRDALLAAAKLQK